jgi:hypothetical protein
VVSNDILYSGEDFDREIVTEPGFAVLIVSGCCAEFLRCFGMKREGHFSMRVLILAKTSSPGTAFTVPLNRCNERPAHIDIPEKSTTNP